MPAVFPDSNKDGRADNLEVERRFLGILGVFHDNDRSEYR
jgi:predicted component of type VI protein secretion system